MRNSLLSVIALLWISNVIGQSKISFEIISEGHTRPVEIAFDINNFLYVVEKPGIITVNDFEAKVKSTFLDISDRVNSSTSERGLLGLAFSPNYSQDSLFYVHYTTLTQSIISQFKMSASYTADPASETIVLTIDQPLRNHNGGSLKFGPDGLLYIGMGDGGGAGDPQNASQDDFTLLGKMLRIDVSTLPYTIPPSNPFSQSTVRKKEIWANGLRNPWKFSFDSETGDLYIADVGQNKWEEVNVCRKADQKRGIINFGWRCYEGFEAFNLDGCSGTDTYDFPVHVYSNERNEDGCSVTGGYVYRGIDIPLLTGQYIYGDFCSGKIWSLAYSACSESWENQEIAQVGAGVLSSFGQDMNGELYYANYDQGTIHRINQGTCTIPVEINVEHPFCKDEGSILITEVSSDITDIIIEGGSFDNLRDGFYSLEVTHDGGCKFSTCIELEDEIEYPLDTIINPSELLVCEGNSLITSFEDAFIQNLDTFFLNLYKDSILEVVDWDGVVEVTPGVYAFTINTNSGCESDFFTFLDAKLATVPDLEITQEGNDLVATMGFQSYQWFKGFTILSGETTNRLQNFEPGESYSVTATTNDGCNTSADPFITSNLDDELLSLIKIAGNPVHDKLIVELRPAVTTMEYKIVNASGSQLQEGKLKSGSNPIDVSNLPAAHYFIIISSKGQTATLPFQKI